MNKLSEQQLDQMDPLKDNFFMPVSNTKPYFKAAFEGFAGSGKTYTSGQVAIGLHKKIKSQKPVVIFDTEKAAKFLKPMFAKAGIELLVKESKTLADLKTTMHKLSKEGVADILIIDSISHVWESFLEEYKNKPLQQGRSAKLRLEFQDWGIIKPTWKQNFSDPFVQMPIHIIMTGRAGYEYENELNKETGKREIYKSGVKMKVEGETAYEPDMLVLMERYQEMEGGSVKSVERTATIIKDRSTVIDGKTFNNPTFKDFEPAIDVMLENPDYRMNDEKDSTGLFRTEEDKMDYKRKITIALEKIENELLRAWPGRSAAETTAKVNALETAFSTRSWTEISETMSLQKLELGLATIKNIVELEIKKQFPEVEPEDSNPAKEMKKGMKAEKAKVKA